MEPLHASNTNGGADRLIQLVGFKVNEEEYGIDILNVQEINRMMDITRVPNAPEFVEGVINLRGKVLPVVDLRKRFGLERKEYDKHTRIVVVELVGKTIGCIVDAVSEVLRIPSNVIEPPPKLAVGAGGQFIKSVGKLQDRLLLLLDMEKLFSEKEEEQLAVV
jgi:purine-binding chemotaxis protein CheW